MYTLTFCINPIMKWWFPDQCNISPPKGKGVKTETLLSGLIYDNRSDDYSRVDSVLRPNRLENTTDSQKIIRSQQEFRRGQTTTMRTFRLRGLGSWGLQDSLCEYMVLETKVYPESKIGRVLRRKFDTERLLRRYGSMQGTILVTRFVLYIEDQSSKPKK